MSETDTFAARIHILLARSCSTAVVIRRGPSKQVATFLWDRRKDTFKIGQWLKGRIYERRSDLSPDGKHMIYFAMNGKWESEVRGAWTAVSKVPYVKALDLVAKGDCWEGGGLFLDNKQYWLNDRYHDKAKNIHMFSGLRCAPNLRPDVFYGSECTGVYYPRLIRDGWRLTTESDRGEWNSETVFEKQLSKGWVLRKIAHEQVGTPIGKGCYWDEHELQNTVSNTLIKCPDWEWAEWDQDAIIWAEFGKLYRTRFASQTALKPSKLLHDFSPYAFEPIEAPY